jgi:hypothetical protein
MSCPVSTINRIKEAANRKLTTDKPLSEKRSIVIVNANGLRELHAQSTEALAVMPPSGAIILDEEVRNFLATGLAIMASHRTTDPAETHLDNPPG